MNDSYFIPPIYGFYAIYSQTPEGVPYYYANGEPVLLPYTVPPNTYVTIVKTQVKNNHSFEHELNSFTNDICKSTNKFMKKLFN